MRLNRRTLLSGAIAGAPTLTTRRADAQSSPWTLLDDAGGPAARWDHVLLAAPDHQRLYLFGGRDGNGAALADLWAYDLTTKDWRQVEAPGPASRFGMAAAVTPDGRGFLLFGGQSQDLFYNDLWAFDFESEAWTLLDDGSSTAPSPRYGLGGDFDASGRFLISHGFTFEGRFDDTWALDPLSASWLDVSPAPESRPLRRCLHEVWATGDKSQLLLYAGCSSGYGPCPQGDLWSFDTASGRWTAISPQAVPAARSNPAVSSSSLGSLLVGGLTESGPTADVWRGEFVGNQFTWEELASASNIIPARSSHDMAARGSDVYVFGGLGHEGALSDLWRLSLDQ